MIMNATIRTHTFLLNRFFSEKDKNNFDRVDSLESFHPPLTLSTLGKIFSRRHIEIIFLFSLKTDFNISCKLSPPVFWGKKISMSLCHLMN